MSSGTLATRSAGQVIVASFFNDIQQIFGGDFVGHDASGNPASAQNLGNSAFPWGTAYITSLILNGSALDISQIESAAYKIVSGKKRTTSNQPDFIRAAGSTTNYTIQATSTNLVLQIAGVTATWTADVTQAGTVAPAATNTATVNDGTAAGQAATRTWGEYGSGAGQPYYPITISSAGANFSARAGSWQAFKIGTEYFLGYLETGSTQITRALRGFFLDSTGAPVKRTTFSNGATITIMNLGWVFLDQDGVTVDTIFTGAGVNNSPVVDAAAPASPATGDYWYDTTTDKWKKYSGGVWSIVNRILVGMVVMDSTNCVASRSFEFFALNRETNTIEVEQFSATVCRGVTIGQRVTVNGRRIHYQSSRPTWNTATNLAPSSDRYNAAVTASGLFAEFLYISDLGEEKISDVEPMYRPDLLGWYHPWNTWRYVARVTINGSAQFITPVFNLSNVVGVGLSGVYQIGNYLYFSNSGVASIGTSSPDTTLCPDTLLHLQSQSSSFNANRTQLTLEGRYGGGGAGISFQSRTSSGGTRVEMARITADVEGTWDTTAANQKAGLRFFTAQNGTLTERMRLDNKGYLNLGTISSISSLNASPLTIYSGGGTQHICLQSAGLNFTLGEGGRNVDCGLSNNMTTGRIELITYNGTGTQAALSVNPSTANGVIQINANGWVGVNFVNCNTSSSAVAGTNALPSNPVGFLYIQINGSNQRVPYYN